MAKQLTDLTLATQIALTDLLWIRNGGIDKKVTLGLLEASVSVEWYGASSSASAATNTAAIQQALDDLQSTPCLLRFPGDYAISSPLVMSNVSGAILQGNGRGVSFLRPSAALAGQTVLALHDCRECAIRDLSITGNVSFPPGACLESRNIVGDAVNPYHNEFRNLILGSEEDDSSVNGLKFTAASDTNNDGHSIYDLTIRGTSGAALSIAHTQSQLHRIYNLNVEGCEVGIDCVNGGCYNLFGGQFRCYSTNFHFGSGTYYGHTTTINNVSIEDGAVTLDAEATSADVCISIHHLDKVLGDATPLPSGTVDINFASSNGQLTVTNSRFKNGIPVTAVLSGTSSVVRWHGNEDSIEEFSFAGELHMSGNSHLAGTCTILPLGSPATGQAWVMGDTGGGFTRHQLRAFGDYLTLYGESGTLIDSGAGIQFRSGGVDKWSIQGPEGGSNLIVQTDGLADIGLPTTCRPNIVYIKTQTVCPMVVMAEQTDPGGTANQGKLYTRDNGAGKTQLCVQFGTGAVQVIATEP